MGFYNKNINFELILSRPIEWLLKYELKYPHNSFKIPTIKYHAGGYESESDEEEIKEIENRYISNKHWLYFILYLFIYFC